MRKHTKGQGNNETPNDAQTFIEREMTQSQQESGNSNASRIVYHVRFIHDQRENLPPMFHSKFAAAHKNVSP